MLVEYGTSLLRRGTVCREQLATDLEPSALTSAQEQVLRYAADLARLYSQANQDRKALQRLEERLVVMAHASLSLVQALSLQEVSERLLSFTASLFGLTSAAVYVDRGGRFTALSQQPDGSNYPAVAPVEVADLAAIGNEPDEFASDPWSRFTGGESAVVIPLLGRRRAVGFLVGQGELPFLRDHGADALVPLVSLLAANAGVVLENLLLEERRGLPLASALQSPGAGGENQGMYGSSPPMQRVFDLIARLGRVDSSILITGETGTGKALVAKALHATSSFAQGPCVTINCAAIPEQLVESELFGHEAGAFTGATKRHRGRVEQAQNGTLLLDEIGELPLAVQSKLLLFLEERRFMRVGGEKELTANVRILSATNRDLEAEVRGKRFRSDLLYRLNVFTIDLPPLRERATDVLTIARRQAAEVAQRYQLPPPQFDSSAEARLLAYAWPGNVRELRNVIEKAVILAGGGPIPLELLPGRETCSGPLQRPQASQPGGGGSRVGEGLVTFDQGNTFAEAKSSMIDRWEAEFLNSLLRVTAGNVAKASRLAKMDKKHLHRKINQHEINVEQLRQGG